MQTLADPAELQRVTTSWRAQGLRVGFVPTMGYLHRGHTSLMDLAAPRCDRLVVSIYVNPKQFAPDEDLDAYPRDPEGDAARCAAHGADLLFTPSELYPADFSTRVIVEGVTAGLCGGDRPTHFEGVTTVVARLFGLVQPSVAVFGEKDYQQLATIRRMVRDLAMPIEVLGAPLVRDDDGLALSSRNAYLSAEQRQRALSLNRALQSMVGAFMDGQRDAAALEALGRRLIDADEIDYVEVRDAESLERVVRIDRPARCFGAARYGNTRLIDNRALELR